MKVYIVWYITENSSHRMWGLYRDGDEAEQKAEMIRQEYRYEAWVNEEWVH